MKSYLDIVNNVITNGTLKDNRTGTYTLSLPNQVFSHDMSKGFPLLTTKKMPLRVIAVELEGFIKGITSKKWYQNRNCHIWDEWANPKLVNWVIKQHNSDKKEIQKECDDLGPIYGYQWRRFNQVYDENDNGCLPQYDQLKTIVDTLHNNPDDRRMVCSAWNPVQMDRMALPPCHFAWGLVHNNGVLSLYWVQRSCDLMLGVPFNIASYGLLLELLCKEANMQAGNLTGLLADCHIYQNHYEGAREQCARLPAILPTITITPQEDFDIFQWTYKDILLENYNYQDKIDFKVAV